MRKSGDLVTDGRVESSESTEALRAILAPLDKVALGVAVGMLSGTALFAATVILIVRGGDTVGPHLSLLSQYIPGYTVTWSGSVVGGIGGLVAGFLLGFGVAAVRNAIAEIYIQASLLLGRLDQFLDSM